MLGVIIAVVFVSLMVIGAVIRYSYNRRQAEKRRRNEEPKPLVFIAGRASQEVTTAMTIPPPTYHMDAPPSYTDASQKESQVV